MSLPRKQGSVEGSSGRPVWTGQISFGLVSIPVGLYGAVAPSEKISFHLLHRKEMAPIQYKKFCSLEGVEVDADEIVRARKTSKNRWVILEKEELERAAKEAVAEESPGTIEVLQFVPPETVDPLSLDEPYFVVPRRGGEKAYGVLRDALLDRRRAGIVRFAFRTRPHLGALLPGVTVLSLTTLRPFELMRDPSDLEVPRLPKRPAEIKLAELLIDILSGFDRWHAIRKTAVIEKVSSAEYYGEGYQDIYTRVPDIANAREILGWEPRYSLRDALTYTVQHYLGADSGGRCRFCRQSLNALTRFRPAEAMTATIPAKNRPNENCVERMSARKKSVRTMMSDPLR